MFIDERTEHTTLLSMYIKHSNNENRISVIALCKCDMRTGDNSNAAPYQCFQIKNLSVNKCYEKSLTIQLTAFLRTRDHNIG